MWAPSASHHYQHGITGKGQKGVLTAASIAKGASKVVPRTMSQLHVKKAVMPRALPYTARTRKRKSKLLEFIARMIKAALTFTSIWQLLTSATVARFRWIREARMVSQTHFGRLLRKRRMRG